MSKRRLLYASSSLDSTRSIIFRRLGMVSVLPVICSEFFARKRNSSGTILANKTSNDFNQSAALIAALFANPVNLSNLHQSWFMKKNQTSQSNGNVAVEIYVAFLRPNSSYVSAKLGEHAFHPQSMSLSVVSIARRYPTVILCQWRIQSYFSSERKPMDGRQHDPLQQSIGFGSESIPHSSTNTTG